MEPAADADDDRAVLPERQQISAIPALRTGDLGPAVILLPVLERLGGAAGKFLAVFGQTPLFFYVLHLYAARGAAVALESARGFSLREVEAFAASRAPPENFGVGLVGTYVAWMALVAALYPVCRWFARVQAASVLLVAQLPVSVALERLLERL